MSKKEYIIGSGDIESFITYYTAKRFWYRVNNRRNR